MCAEHNLKKEKLAIKYQQGEGSTAPNSSAWKNCSTPKSRLLDTVWADVKKMETAQKSKKGSFRADSSFWPKWSTAQIATAGQKHWKMSTARIIKKFKVWNMYGSLVIKQSSLG